MSRRCLTFAQDVDVWLAQIVSEMMLIGGVAVDFFKRQFNAHGLNL